MKHLVPKKLLHRRWGDLLRRVDHVRVDEDIHVENEVGQERSLLVYEIAL